MEEKYRLTIDEGTEDAFVKEYTREELESKKDYIRDTYAGRYKVDRVGDADLNNIDDAGNYTLRIGDFSKSYTGSELKGKMDYINQTYGGQYTIESSYGSYNDMDSLFNDIPSARERLEAFNAEHGAFMDDFEARDTAETKMARAGMSSGLVVPAEGSITGEERQRYNDLYKQEEALKKAWYNSPEYLESQGQTAVHLAQMRNEIDRGRLAFAQNNPVIEGYNPSATRGAEADVELQLFETASRIIDDTIKLHNAPSRYDGANAWQNVKKFAKGTGDTLSDVDFWTSGLTEIADNLGVRNVLQKVQKELGNLNNLDEATIEGVLSPAEKAVLQAWALNAQEQLNRSGDLSRGYQAGQSATESLGFMAEFALTGGVGKAASEGVETMAKWLGRKVLGQMDDAAAATVREMGEKIAKSTVGKYGARLADALAETAGKTLVMPSTFRNISEKAAEIQEDAEGNRYLTRMNDAFAKGFTDSFIENLSEGGRVNAIGDLIGDVAGKIPAYKKIVDKFANSKAGELLTAFNSSGIMNTLRAGGWHGFGEEYLEEWYGNALRTITGLDKDALKDFATVDNQLITITSFLPMTIFGGTVSTAQVLSAKKGLDKKAEMLRSALLERGYDEKQADNMIDMMRGASPAEISQTLTPIVNAVALRDLNEAAALMKPVGEFAEAVRRWQSFDTKYQYQEQEQRDNLRTQMTDTLGQFWQEDENGRQTVQRGVNANGEVVYLLGKPTAEEAQSGMPQQVAAITSEGRKVFVDPSAVQLEEELEMNDFLGTEIMAEKGNKEQARMIEEKEKALAQVRQMSAPGTTVNLGTNEAPIVGTVAQRTPDGVVITMEDGSARQVSYEELGNYVGVNTTPLTDAQMDERDADALSADRAQREAELDMEYENLGSSEDELIEAEAEVEQAVEAATPLPTKADGSVDQTALWNEDPARWAQWNDEQRQDGGMNSLAYINGAIANESAKIAEMQAGYDAITDFDERDALEQEVAAVRERLQTLVDLRDKYSVQAEVAAQAQQANAVAQMTEEEKAEAEEQRREPLRKKAQEWSSRLGVKVNIAESLSDVKEEQAREQILRIDVSGSKERATGWFNPTTGEVTIYLPHTTDSSEIEKTIVHEVVAHKGLRGLLGQEGFNVLCDSVWEMMTEEERQKYLAYPGVNGNKRAAADEYIAHYAETMNLEESKPVWDRIMDLIVRILNSMGVRLDMSREQLSDIIVASYQKLVKEAENSVSSQHGQEENNISAEERGYSAVSKTGDGRGDQEQNVGDSGAISEGLLGLPGNGSDVRSSGGTDGRGEAGIGKIGERDRSGEISEQQISAPYSGEPTEITSNDGEVIADTNGNGSVRFSIRTWREGGRDYLAAWLANDTVLTDEEKADILARMDEFYENAQKYTDTYVPFGTWSEAAVRYDNNGNPLMSVIKANGDYSMNLDFSLVCKKRRPLNRLLRTLINRNAFGTYSLREREIAEINWILQEHGFEVACALCFVDSKRYRVTGVADVFAALYNKLVEALAPKGATIAHFNYNGNPNVEAVEDGIDTLPDDQLNWNKFEKLAKKFKPTSVEGKVAQLLRENPAQRKLVDATDFIEAEGFEAVKANNQELLKLYNAKKGTGGPKASFGDVQYLNDILKKEKSFDVDKAYSVGGVRIQSFSDFVPHMYFDYMQLFAELAAKKLPAHAYTKEVLFAKIFGLTGLKINLSLVPAVVEGGIAPGLDAEGNYAWADAVRDAEGNIIQQAQSFPFDEAMAIQNAPGYSKNCGAIAVGISDEHIEKMLDDPNIQFIIPYHKSSLNAIVARMTNIDQYKDYTNVQTTKKASGTKLDKDTKDFNFNEYLHNLGENGTPQQAAQAYLDWCRENGFKPKFSQFAYHPNYYKLLVDFNTIDTTTGEYTPQGSVTMTFPTEESAFGNVETLIQQGLQEDVQLEGKLESEIEEIADEVEARLADIAKEPQLSEKEQMKRMAQLADERAAQIKDRAAQAIDLETEAKKAVAADIAFRFIGEQAAQRVDQMTNSNVMMDNLQTAKDMESQLSPKWSQKKNPAARKIKMATGWERGVDGLWRYEMPDFEYKAKPDGQKKFTLSELIEDKTLFVEYPQMADIPVEFKDLPDGVQGITTRTEDGYQIEMSNTVYRNTNPAVADALNRFMADHPEVFLRITKKTATREDVQLFDSYFNGIDAYADEMGGRNVLAHEIQHVIQYMEGFALGGSADMFDTHDPQAAALAKRYEQESNEAKRLSKEYGDIQRKIGLARFVGHTSLLNTLINDAARIQQEYNMRLANCRDIVKVLRGYGVIGQQGYDNLAGEVEAKNVEARLDKTPEQRRESLIADTQEVEHRFQTILRDNLMTDYAESRISFRMSNENQAIFVSNAARAVEGIKQEKATPEQWLKMIEKAGGLKAGEDKWMGLSDWLKASDKKTLTKQEVLDFINENMIVIEEQHYSNDEVAASANKELNEKYPGWEEAFSMDWDGYMDEPYASIWDNETAVELYNNNHEDQIELDEDGEFENLDDESKVMDFGKELAEIYYRGNSEVRPIHGTRSSYQTRGLSDNHEIALTVPTIERWKADDAVHFGDAGDGRAIAWIRFGETKYRPAGIADEIAALDKAILDYEGETSDKEYKALVEKKHALLRASRAQKVLVIDEIQSNRHQEGREKGYKKSNNEIYKALEAFQSFNRSMKLKYGLNSEVADWGEDDRAEFNRLRDAHSDAMKGFDKGVPDAPFDKNWHELAMKRMLRYAAENGYDVIAWTKGDQQANRYDLSRTVKKISVYPSKDGSRNVNLHLIDRENDFKNLVVDSEGMVTFGEYKGRALADVVGKEASMKIMSATRSTEFTGDNLQVGGEGMRGFYDKMLPSFMNKYGKKWGIKVEDIDLPNLGKYGYTMHSVPVTEEMKASVMEGQVMFRTTEITPEVRDEMDVISATALINGNYMKAPNGADTNLTAEQWAMVRTKNFLRWFGDWINDPENASKVVDENGEPKVVYHGSTAMFTVFDKSRIGSATGTADGRGFYFTTDRDYALGYKSPDGQLFEVFLNIEKPLSYDKKTITKAQLRKILKEADRVEYEQEGEHYMLSNYANYNDVGIEGAVNEGANLEYDYADNDVELIGSLIGGSGSFDLIMNAVKKVTGKSGMIAPKDNGTIHYVVTDPTGIKSATDNTGEFSEEEGDIRFRTSLELDEEFGDAWRNQQNEDGRHSTQVANTKSTYEKIGRYLEDAGMKGASILDASSGLGLGTQALREMGFKVDDVEPFPSENREAPTFSSYADIDGKYDVVISNAVLNVIPDDWRADVLHQMADAVKDGGKMIINTRPASNIAQQGVEGKTRITLDSPSEILVKRGDRIAAYQKGFTSEELAAWITSELGEGWRVEKATKKNSGISGEGTAVVIKESDDTRFRVTGTPTDEVVANGVDLTPAQTAELAGNIFAALPEESRKKITEGLSNVFDLKDAIMQIPTSLAMKEKWNDEDRQMAEIVASEVTKMAGEMTRPFSASEGLWVLYNALNPISEYDIVSQASRALVQRNLGFDAATLEVENEAKEDVRFRTVGNASANAKASLYNRGAANVWTRLKESFVDMNASVEELVNAIEKASGKKAEGFENVLLALNQQSSKGLAAMETYEQKFLNKMLNEIRAIMDKTDFKYEDIVRYVILKHGLERNEKMAQRDAKAHYQKIYDDIIAKIKGMNPAQKRTYLTNAQLKDSDAKAELARLQGVNTSALTPDQLRDHKKELAKAKKEASEAAEHLVRAQKIATMTEQDAQNELDKIFKKIEKGTDSVYKEMRKNDYSGISSMFYDTLGVDRKNYATEEEYQSALMQAKADKYDNLGDIEGAAQTEVTLFENAVDTKDLWKSINNATKETLRQQYEANMISKDQYLNLRDMFEFYVPLRGFADNTAEDMYTYYRRPNSTGYTKPILGAEGRKTEAESPFGWIAAMAGSAIASNVKNEAKLALYYFVANRPENGIATLSRTWFVHTPGDVDANGKKIFRPAYPPFNEDLSSASAKGDYEIWQANMRNLQSQGLAYESGQKLNLGDAVVNISDKNKPEHIVNVKIGGKDYTIIINGNPRAAQAINGDLNIETDDTYNNVLLGPWLRWLSSVNTSYNPEFWATNMMRDMAFTWMAVNIKEDPAYRRRFSENYRKAFQVISLAAKNEKGTLGNSYIEQMYQEFVQYGGVTGYTQIKDNETWEKEIENYLKKSDASTSKAIKAVKDGLHAMHRFGESLEQVSRFAAFLTSREMGKSTPEAINDAKEITVNFNRKGSGKRISFKEAKKLTKKNGQKLNDVEAALVSGITFLAPIARSTIMFFNASVQALNAWFKLWKANKLRSLSWVIGYAAIGVMNALIHALLDDDDDYLDMPQYERRSSLMLGGNGVYFKWALPQEMSAFYALGELSVETILGRNPHQSAAAEAAKVVGELLPINVAKVFLDKGGWVDAMPSQIKSALELLRNEDYKGDVIFNEQKWLSEGERERTANWESAYKGTGRIYIGISKLLNNLTDSKDLDEAGWINIHPESLEHVVESMTGGVGRTVSKLFNFITAAINPEEDVTVKQTPFLNRFLTINDERFRNVHVNDVFDYYEAEAEHAATLEKKYKKDGNSEALKNLRMSDEYKLIKIYSKYKKSLEKIQEKIKVADGTAERKDLMKQQDELKRRMIKEISELP